MPEMPERENPTECEIVDMFLLEYVLNHLDPETEEFIVAHLAKCPWCEDDFVFFVNFLVHFRSHMRGQS